MLEQKVLKTSNKIPELDSNKSNEKTQSCNSLNQPFEQFINTKIKLTKSQRKRIKKQLIKKQHTIEAVCAVEKDKSSEALFTGLATQVNNSTIINIKSLKKKQKKANQATNSSKEIPEPLLLTDELKDDMPIQKANSKSKKLKNRKSNALELKNTSKPENIYQSKKKNDNSKKAEPITLFCKKINDISDFSDSEEYKTINYNYFDELNKQDNESNQVDSIVGENLCSDEENDQGGWVKVAGNRQLITETKKSKKMIINPLPLINQTIITKKKVKISNSLNSLDSFKDIPEHKLKSTDKKEFLHDNVINESDFNIEGINSNEKNKLSLEVADKLSTVDLLIPNSIDEEEVMLKKALELSLKESKISLDANNPFNNQKKTLNKLGLDDFNDDSNFLQIKGVNINSLMSKNLINPTYKPQQQPLLQQTYQQTKQLQPAIDIKQINGKSIINRPTTCVINKNVTSFAAVAAASLNKGTITKAIIANPKQVPFKWNNLKSSNPPEIKKIDEPMLNQINLGQYNTDIESKKKSSSSIKEFKENGIDLPLLVKSSLDIDEKKDLGLMIDSDNLFQNKKVSVPMPSPFTMIDNLFSNNNLQENDHANAFYGIESIVNDVCQTQSPSFG